MSNPMSLDGRVILVTGAGQGIGMAISRTALEQGANVVGIDMNPETLQNSAAELGDHFLPIAGNVTDPEFAERAVAEGVEKFGAIHGLVNNAGITRPAMIDKMTQQQWQSVIDVNMTGTMNFIQAVGRHMLERAKAGDKNPGAIVNISSDAGRRGSLGQINYAAAKSAVFGMTMTAAREWARFGIRSNAVCFGVVATAMTETVRTDERFADTYLAQIPLGRWSTPEEVSVPVCFLLSEGASYITGQVLSVNGGFTIAM